MLCYNDAQHYKLCTGRQIVSLFHLFDFPSVCLFTLPYNASKYGFSWCTRMGFVSLVHDLCRFGVSQGPRILSCDVAFQLAYRRSLVLPRCLLVTEIMLGGAPGVFLNHEQMTMLNKTYKCVNVLAKFIFHFVQVFQSYMYIWTFIFLQKKSC